LFVVSVLCVYCSNYAVSKQIRLRQIMRKCPYSQTKFCQKIHCSIYCLDFSFSL
jgi:hypothetical protein